MPQIIQGDSLAVLATMPDNSIDAVVTDPFGGSGTAAVGYADY